MQYMPDLESYPQITALGGGHGLATVAEAIAYEYPEAQTTALSTVVDSGSATGRVREMLDELGVGAYGLGDLRNVLGKVSTNLGGGMFAERFDDSATQETLAAKNEDMLAVLRAQGMDDAQARIALDGAVDLGRRFDSLKGHTYGNLVLGSLVRSQGGLVRGLDVANQWLQTSNTRVQTLTETPHHLNMLDNGTHYFTEAEIDDHQVEDPENARIWLTPSAEITPDAERAIAEADILVIAPGSLWTSTLPGLAINGVAEAIQAQARRSGTSRIIVANLVQEPNAGAMSMATYVSRIEEMAGARFAVVHNTDVGSVPPTYDALHDEDGTLGERGFGAKLVSATGPKIDENDPLADTPQRSKAPLHDRPALAGAIVATHQAVQTSSLAV